MTDQRPYPHDLAAERAVLGACMWIRSCLAEVVGAGLEAGAFYRQDHARLFEALQRADAADVPINESPLLLPWLEHEGRGGKDLLQYGGDAYVLEMPDHITSTVNLLMYVETVKKAAHLRALLKVTEGVRDAAFAGGAEPEELAATLTAAASASPSPKGGWRRMSDVLPEALKKAEEAQAEPKRYGGISTGYAGIDELTGGLHAGDLVILAGRPGKGKTALALNMLQLVVDAGHTAGVVSLEMTSGSLATRTLSGMSGATARDLRSGQVDPHFLFKLREMLKENPEYLDRLHVDDRPATVSQIAARARQLKQQAEAEGETLVLLVVDYLQIVDTEPHLMRAKREVQVAFMSKNLKKLAKELGCTVIALAQLNRQVEERADKTPKASDLRESGAVEQDADIIILMAREGSDATAHLVKCRNGETGDVPLHFEGRTTTFSDAIPQEPDRSEGWGGETQ